MGVNVHLAFKTKIEDDMFSIECDLSRAFAYFISGDRPTELKNLEELSNAKLRFFWDLEPVSGQIPNVVEGIEYSIEYFEDNGEKEKLVEYQNILSSYLDGSYFQDENNWIEIELLENTVDKLVGFMKSNPDYHKRMKIDSSYGDYFKNENRDSLLNDFESIQKALNVAKSKGINFVTFETF